MVYVLTQTDPLPAEPYLTTAEYKAAPTGVDTSNLVKGDQAASLAELGNVIVRASSWADTICGQVLAATPDVEGGRVTVTRDGTLRIHPRQTPIVEVTGLSYGATPGSLVALTDLSTVWVEPAMIVVPMTTVSPLYMGSLGFATVIPGRDVYAQWRYIAGWPNTTLYSPASAGDTHVTVTNPCGAIPGSQITIYDGAQTETIQVGPGYVPGVSTLTLTAGLRYPHTQPGVSVSALPPSAKQAVILLTSALIKTRGSSAVVMASVTGEPARKKAKSEPGGMTEIDLACSLLAPFRRVR